MAILFVWNNEYSVGNDTLDEQHKHLFELGNKIQKADKSEARKFVMELYKYVNEHFALEEKHMKTIGYPEYEAHKRHHEKLISDLNRLSDGFSNDDFETLVVFLHKWLVKHVLYEDKKYFSFLHKKK